MYALVQWTCENKTSIVTRDALLESQVGEQTYVRFGNKKFKATIKMMSGKIYLYTIKNYMRNINHIYIVIIYKR